MLSNSIVYQREIFGERKRQSIQEAPLSSDKLPQPQSGGTVTLISHNHQHQDKVLSHQKDYDLMKAQMRAFFSIKIFLYVICTLYFFRHNAIGH